VPTLRITQSGPNIEAAFEGDGLPRQTETRPFSFQLSPQDAEDIRWYLEDYLVYPVDPLPKTAARIERRMREIGRELFRGILHGSDVWSSAKHRLEETRVEVESDIANAVVPWKLLRPPDLDQPLALHVPAFVRGHSQAALRPKPVESSGKIRILLAICRPGGADDVPFRGPSMIFPTACDRAEARIRSTSRSDAERKICRNPLGPTPTSRSPARTTNRDVRKKAIALIPAIRTCVHRDCSNQWNACINPRAPSDAATLIAM
jgi:hypothetical protein